MDKLRTLITHYGPVFSHGVMAGVLIYLTFVSGSASG